MRTTRHERALAVCAAVLLAACGSGAGPTAPATTTPSPSPTASPSPALAPTPTPAAVRPAYLGEIAAVLGATAAVDSATMEFAVVFEGNSTVADGTGMHGSGEFAFGDTLRARISLDMSAFGQGTVDVIQDGVILYMRGDAFASVTPEGRWLRVDTASDHPNAVAFAGSMSQQTNPWAALHLLQGATATPEELQPETIDGVEARHLRVQVDFDQAIDRATGSIHDYLVVLIAGIREQGFGPTFVADVWFDAESRIRRAVYRLPVGPLRGDGEMMMTYDIADFGRTVPIELPAPDDVVDVESLELNP